MQARLAREQGGEAETLLRCTLEYGTHETARLDYDLGFQVNVLQTFEVVPVASTLLRCAAERR